jgi:hypothetical protein
MITDKTHRMFNHYQSPLACLFEKERGSSAGYGIIIQPVSRSRYLHGYLPEHPAYFFFILPAKTGMEAEYSLKTVLQLVLR